jgi:hypothetical protein
MMKTLLLVAGLCLFALGCAPEDGTGPGTTGTDTTVTTPADSATPGADTTPGATATTPSGTGDGVAP